MQSVLCFTGTATGLDRSERPALFEIAGRLLLFEENGAAINGLPEFFRDYYCRPVPPEASIPPSATINLQVGDFPREIAGAFQGIDILGGGVAYTVGRTNIFDYQTGRVIARADEPRRVDILARRPLDLSRFEDLQIVNRAISTALRRSNLYELHSAAVVEPNSGCGVLFAGGSGSGKSTVTLQLATNGWQYLTDDILFLKDEGGFLKAYPFRRGFAVTRSTVEASGVQVRQALANENWQVGSKKLFMPQDLFPEAFLADCTPRVIFFPTVTDDRKSLVKALTPRETMLELIKLNPWSCYDPVTSVEHLAALALLAKQCRGFSWLAGRDLLEDPGLAAALVCEQMDSIY